MATLLKEFNQKYEIERIKFKQLIKKCNARSEYFVQIETQYNNLISFIESKSSVHLLGRVREIEGFIKTTSEELVKTEFLNTDQLKLPPSL